MPTLADLFPVGFLGLFQLIGGLAVGSGLRTLLLNRSRVSFFLIVWGLGFGGSPTLISLALAVTSPYPLLALVGPVIFLGALLFAIVLLPWLVEAVGSGLLLLLALGLLFMLVGMFMGFFLIRDQDLLGGLVFGVIFFGVGALLSGLGIWSLIADKPGRISDS